ncbi:MAG TPA: TolC family protein, partial [Burkholderiales bacterium]|nr:TolC family protein [Burkholderiales bacterium]
MRVLALPGLAAGLVLLAAPAAPALARTLTFPEALQLTLGASPRLREAEAQTAAAAGAQSAARGAGLPRLSLSAAGTRSDNPLTVLGERLSQRGATFADFGADQFTGPGSLGVAPDALNRPGGYNNFNTKLEVDVPLYTGGRTQAQSERAARLVEAARMGDASAR